ncbi:AAA family ATPase [Chloroflexota bacterium]
MSEEFTRKVAVLVDNISKVVVANPEVIKLCLLGLFCQGHVLLDDFPGVGKTLLAKSLAQSLKAQFNRIQFTPDLLPTDITGSSIYDQNNGDFRFIPGPVFANIVLADEINRSGPRTQSALLEAMGERFITFDGITRPLPSPFFVIATRNLSETHGVFPLPQSQLDRFLFCFGIGYPSLEEEVLILEKHEHGEPELGAVFTAEDIIAMQKDVLEVQVARPIKEYIARIVTETRVDSISTSGISPRGAVALQKAAQGRAAMEDRNFVTPDDIKVIAPVVLRHRIAIRSSEPDYASKYIDDLLKRIAVPL